MRSRGGFRKNEIEPTNQGALCGICIRCCACAISTRRSIFIATSSGLKEVRRIVSDQGKFTLVFLAAAGDDGLVAKGPENRAAPLVELTYNWDSKEDYGEARYFGHLAYEVDDIYATCEKLMKAGVTINRPPRDGMMAFVRSPDKQSIELLQKGAALPPKEPWTSMPNTGHW